MGGWEPGGERKGGEESVLLQRMKASPTPYSESIVLVDVKITNAFDTRTVHRCGVLL